MKTKRFCKSTVSLLLVVMMLMSIVTMGVVNVSAAQTDIAETNANNITLYFTRPNTDGWKDHGVSAYCFNETNDANNAGWPGISLTKSYDNEFGEEVYVYTVDKDAFTHIIFNNQNNGKQTSNIPLAGLQNNDIIYYDSDGNLVIPNHGVATYSVRGEMSEAGWGNEKTMTKSEDTEGRTIYYDGPYKKGAYQFKLYGTDWINANESVNLYTSDAFTVQQNYNNNNNYYVNATADFYVVYTLGTNNYVSCVSELPTNTQPTEPPVTTTTVTVGIADDISDPNRFGITWYSSKDGDSGRVEITPTGESASYVLTDGSTKKFNLYTAVIPEKYTNYFWSVAIGDYLNPGISDTEVQDGNILLLIGEGANNKGEQDVVLNEPVIAPTTLPEYIYLRDDTTSSRLDDDDANMFAKFNDAEGKKHQMKQRVDTTTGKITWGVEVPKGATKVTFMRYPVVGKDALNTSKELSLTENKPLYTVTNVTDLVGTWNSIDTGFSFASDSDITNFWSDVWVDTKGYGDAKDAVRWWYDGSKYHIFLPSHTPSSFKLYSNLPSLTINGATITRGQSTTFSNVTNGKNYTFDMTTNEGYSLTGKSLTFHRSGNVSTLFFQTDDQFWTDKIYNTYKDVSGYKDGIETSGKVYLYDETGAQVNTESKASNLKKIKGRGNSSFEASMKLYGKYAYNFNLGGVSSLVENATASKKWCLLANNVDHSMLRNTFAYSLANAIGLKYSPKTRHVDVYDNGEYIGAYTIIEKVEYGKETLMKDLVNLDDVHEEWGSDAYPNEDYEDLIEKHEYAEYKPANGKTYHYKYWDAKSEYSNLSYDHPEGDDSFKNKYNFVLEHELGAKYGTTKDDRFHNEASWFFSPYTGQAVVVKYPEFATEKEMKWIIDMYSKLETAAYGSTPATLDTLNDAIDVDSFAKVYLIQELGLNLDACATSYYMYNSTNANGEAVLKAGPVWDYDWSFGSYHMKKPTKNGQSDYLCNPKQMFIKDKGVSNTTNGSGSSDYNLQAQLAHNTNFWTECQKIWTNTVEPTIWKYIDRDTTTATGGEDTGIMLTKWLTDLDASVEMNEIRWKAYQTDEDSIFSDDSDNWGTKLTSNYNKGTYNFYYTQGGTSGSASASKSYANTVYYLNDWIKTRTEFMSKPTAQGGGGLLDESLKPSYEKVKVGIASYEVDGNTLIVVPDIAIKDTKTGQEISADQIEWKLLIDGKDVDFIAYPTAQKSALTKPASKFTVVAKVKGTDVTFEEYVTIDADKLPKYAVSNVKIYVTQAEGKIVVTPGAAVKFGSSDVKLTDSCTYTVVCNGNTIVTKDSFKTSPTCDINSPVEGDNVITVTVFAPDGTTSESAETTYNYKSVPDGTAVTVTVMFKSSTSYRYRPTISVNGAKAVDMTQDTENGFIGKNTNQTQSYYWYKYDVPAVTGTPVTIEFANKYDMKAKYIIETPLDGTMYFGVDNLNSGTSAVKLPAGEDESSMEIRNFYQTAANMLKPDVTVAAIAYTAINGSRQIVGNTDGDNSLSILDATTSQLYLAKKIELTPTSSALGDYNVDGVTSIMDVTMVQTYLAQ